MKKTLLLFLSLCLLVSCQHKKQEKATPVNLKADSIAQKLSRFTEEVYHKTEFKSYKAISFNLEINRNNAKTVNLKVSFNTDFSRLKIEDKSGIILLFNNGDLYAPNEADIDENLLTYANLFALPFRLKDSELSNGNDSGEDFDGKTYSTFQLESNVLFSKKNESLKIYTDQRTGFLATAIFLNRKDEPFKQARAVVFKNHFTLKQIPMAKNWEFFDWNEKEGLGKKIGEATISKVKFFSPEKGFYKEN